MSALTVPPQPKNDEHRQSLTDGGKGHSERTNYCVNVEESLQTK